MAILPSQVYKKVFEMTVNPPSVASQTVVAHVINTPEPVSIEDTIVINMPTLSVAVATGSYRVTANNTITIDFINPTAAPLDAAPVTMKVIVL